MRGVELEEGESVLWEGAPGRGWLRRNIDRFLIPATLVPVLIGFGWFFAERPRAVPAVVFYGTGALILACGLFMAIGRFPFDAWMRRHTSYTLTSRRVLISRRRRIRAYKLETLPSPFVDWLPTGLGTVRFGDEETIAWGGEFTPARAELIPSVDRVPQFFAISDAIEVAQLVRAAMDRRKQELRAAVWGEGAGG